MASRALSITQRWIWTRQDFFGDLRIQYGFKMGLAGLLALFGTQLLRLPHDNWATLTVLVLMGARYVGSVTVKAIMRVIGTIAGGILGVWLVGDYTSTPEIFLPVLFLVVALASYKFGQFGARQVPYAYFLLGLTTLTVATNGLTDPAHAWQIGLDRTEEILVGIMSSLLVTTLVWPRYAREEFLDAGRAALKTASQLFSGYAQTYTYRASSPAETERLQDAFGQQLSALRNLQQAGARESTIFSARLSNYNAFLVSLTNLYHAALDLTRYRNVVWFIDHMRQETESLSAAISEEFSILTAPRSPGEHLPSGRLNEAFAGFAKRVNEIRDHGVLIAAPLEAAIAFAGQFAAVRAVCEELNNIRSAMEGLPR
ncbi:MAG TPA: FUSC family protein, partial [Chthoniobacterales bacterium]|nr:FUSC family protein [Chthoniobacterales bacterium]